MKDDAKGVIGSALTWALSINQINEVFSLIQIILATIVSGVTLAFIIYKWYKRATSEDSDGGSKVTLDEITELGKEIKEYKEENQNGNKS